MKKLFTVLFVLITAKSFAQNPVPLGSKNSRVYVQGLFSSDSLTNLHLLDSATNKLAFGGANLSYRLSREADGRVYQAIPPSNAFVLFDNVSGGGSTIDTTSLSNRINQKVSYSDTAAMLVGYVRKGDTASMLSPYLRSALGVKYTDTATLSDRINLKQDYSDTTTYDATKKNLADTSAVLRALIGSGGTDTSSLSTRIDARVKYTDTASMLGNYLRKADTSTLSTRINLKLSSSDTTAMLSPYARKTLVADTAAAIRVGINSFANFLYRSQNGLTFKGKSIVLISDSYGIGTGATSAAFGFSQIFAKYVGCTILNYSSNGATLMRQVPINYAGGTNVMSIVSTIPSAGVFDTNIVMICIGLNDAGQNGANYTPANFYLTYDSLITQLVAKGYLVQNIVIVSPWRVQQAGLNFYGVLSGNAAPTFAHMDSFVTKTSDIALNRGCPYVDVYTMQKYSDTNTFADANHRNNRGNYNIAEHIWESLGATMTTIDQQTEYTAIDFSFTGANISNTGTTWNATGTPGSYNINLGLSSSYVAANSSGRIWQDYNGDRGVLGFNTANAATGFTGMEAGFLVASGGLYAVDGGAVGSSLLTVNSGEVYSVLRSGSNFYLQKSTDSGATWSNVYTYSTTSALALYVVCDINTSLINPKLSLFSPFSTGDALGRIYVSNGSSGILPVANDFRYDTTSKTVITPTVNATKYTLSTLNTAPSSSSDTGTTGEIRFTAGYIYVCTATNTWVRVALSSF